jgi:hypothetical protein
MENVRSNEDLVRAYRKFKVLGLAVENIIGPQTGPITEDEQCGVMDLISEIDGMLKAQVE